MSDRIPLIDQLLHCLTGKGDFPVSKDDGLVGGPEDLADLVSLLSLPELREENNPDLPFSIVASIKLGVHKNYIRPLSMSGFRFGAESSHLADWIAKLVRREGQSVFNRTLAFEQGGMSDGSLCFSCNREEGTTTLLLEHGGPNVPIPPLDIWEKGILVRRLHGQAASKRNLFTFQPGVAVAVRLGGSDHGAEILTDEIELGPADWWSLLACTCLQGHLIEAIEVLTHIENETDVFPQSARRFSGFLKGLAAVTQTDGFVLRPLPAVRGEIGVTDGHRSIFSPTLEGVRRTRGVNADLPDPPPRFGLPGSVRLVGWIGAERRGTVSSSIFTSGLAILGKPGFCSC